MLRQMLCRFTGLESSFSRTTQKCWCASHVFPFSKDVSPSKSGPSELEVQYRNVMRKVPQPVVVVTTAKFDPETSSWIKRGMTCSSFTSISLHPPIVSFTMTIQSRMHKLLHGTETFAVHVLAKNQVKYGIHFAKPAEDGVDQFENIPHEQDQQGVPILRDSSAVLMCRHHTVSTIGDHHVWYGEVTNAYPNGTAQEPMLYYLRSFRSVGDEAFMQAFEDTSLPFEEWTHEAHLRMAWNYIRDHGKEDATPLIRSGIHRYNEQNKDKIERGYHETVTMFYIHMISDAVKVCDNPDITFEEFINTNSHLTDKTLLFQYYSPTVISTSEAKTGFILPDKKSLP